MDVGRLVENRSDLLFWGGIILVGIAITYGFLSGIILFFRGQLIKRELESDYGEIGKEPDRRN